MSKIIPSLAVVILTHNSPEMLYDCLKSFEASSVRNLDLTIVVVDNGSKIKYFNKLKSKFPKVILITNDKNYGFAKGINYGIKFAYNQKFEWILLLNDDTTLSPESLETLVRQAELNSYSICGPKILSTDGRIWSLGGKLDHNRFSGGLLGYGMDNNKYTKNSEVDFISGTAMLVNRKVIDKIGFLDEGYFLYYDDVEYCFRAKTAGFKSYIVPESEIIHLETATIKKNSPTHYYHSAKSHLVFVFKRAPVYVKMRELFRIPKTIFELLRSTPVKRKYELLALADFFLGRN